MLVAGYASTAIAQDPENCLSCHRFRGLSRLDRDTNELRLFFCSAEYYIHREGAHARLRCTACHLKSEVEVIPHHVKTRVDCTTECHITPAAAGTALRFSHRRVHESLERSAHRVEKLAELPFNPPLLHDGQSTCLYCHDQPVFGFKGGMPEGFINHAGDTRCDTCHAEELPLEVQYFANHVAARMKPARPPRQLVQVCAVCHSDPAVVDDVYHGHDVVASYLHSFHGKAMLLGSKETATCVECHSSPEGDQHLMLPASAADSSINPTQLPDTCRTVACHPSFPPQMSNAAVHLELDRTAYPPEFYVAAFFILMTASVMLVFFLMVILELFNAALRPMDKEHRLLMELARRLQNHPRGRLLLQRMTVHERIQHWLLAISFIVLVITGMPIKFAADPWASNVIWLFGNLSIARAFHRIAGVVLIGVFLYHLVYLTVKFVQTRRQSRRTGGREPLWKTVYNSPMMVRPEDVREFGQLFAYLLFMRKERPHFGRYNILEKFEYWAVFWGMPVMGLSGLALWNMPVVAEWLSGRAMNFAYIIHSDEAYLAFIYIAAIHLFSVIFAPTVFPLSRGTVTGQAPIHELAEKHRGELWRLADEIGITRAELDATTPHHGHWQTVAINIARRGYSVGVMALYIVVATMSLNFLLSMLLTRETAPMHIVKVPTRLDADAFFAAAATPQEFSTVDTPEVRGPLAHFHKIPQWFQPDPRDTCTTAGCHSPLPHGNRIEVRAFLNMHATFVDCLVCHAEGDRGPADAGWFSLPARTPSGTPAILEMASYLEALPPITADNATAVSTRLQTLLESALPASGHNTQLANWLARVRTTHPESRIFRQLVDEMRDGISLHVRGEYAAKIGFMRDGRVVSDLTADQQAAAREYLAQQKAAPAAQLQPVLDRVHTGIRSVGAMCTPCHAEQPTLVDIAKLGYPPRRVTELRESAIIRSVLKIEAGQPFYLPLDQEAEESGE